MGLRLPQSDIDYLTQQLVESSRWPYEPEYAEALVRQIAGFQWDHILEQLEAIKDLPMECYSRPGGSGCELRNLIEDMKGE